MHNIIPDTAALSAMSMVPVWGDAVGKGGKILRAGFEHGDEVLEAGTKLLDDAKKTIKKINGETEFTKIGRQAHKDYNPGSTYEKEYRLPSGKRADAVDEEAGIVRELKPNNPKAIKRGEKQVQQYVEELQRIKPDKEWKGIVDTYDR